MPPTRHNLFTIKRIVSDWNQWQMSVYFFCQRQARSHAPVCSKNTAGFLIGKKICSFAFWSMLCLMYLLKIQTLLEKSSADVKLTWWAEILLLFWSTRVWPLLSLKWAIPQFDFSLKYFWLCLNKWLSLLMWAPEAHLDLFSNSLESPFLLAWLVAKTLVDNL